MFGSSQEVSLVLRGFNNRAGRNGKLPLLCEAVFEKLGRNSTSLKRLTTAMLDRWVLSLAEDPLGGFAPEKIWKNSAIALSCVFGIVSLSKVDGMTVTERFYQYIFLFSFLILP